MTSSQGGSRPARSALIVVAKQPEAGKVKTRLCPPLSYAAAAALARACLDDTLALASQLGEMALFLGYAPDAAREWFASTYPGVRLLPQGDGDLGARMSRLCDATFSRDADRIVLIGADTPHLAAQTIRAAFATLEDRDTIVLGPARDGGYFLIGLSSPHPALFRGIAWSSDTVLAETLSRARSLSLRTVLLPEECDIDTPADLVWLLDHPTLLSSGLAVGRLAAGLDLLPLVRHHCDSSLEK